MSDLAKFGRDALNFLNGDAIRAMSDGEVGQFLILLARASGVAGASAVSTPTSPAPAPVTKWNPRSSAKSAAPQTAPSVQQLAANAVPHGSGDFSLIATRFRRAFGLTLSHGKLARQSYANNCARFGEEFVLAEFENWQKSNGWMRDKGFTNLFQFYDSLASAQEAVSSVQADEAQTAQKKEKEAAAVTDAVEAGRAATVLAAIRKLEEKKRAAVMTKAVTQNPEELFS